MRAVTATAAPPSRRALVRAGAGDILPLVLGVLPLGLAVGAALAHSTVPALAGWAAAPLVLGGAAQLLTIEMLHAGTAPVAIVVAAVLVNARVVMYGAAIAPWFKDSSRPQRLLAAYPLIDPLFFVSIERFERGDLDQAGRHAYYAGAAVTLLVGWVGVQVLAIAIGDGLPTGAGLHLAAPLAFAGSLAKSVHGRPATIAAVTATLLAVIGTRFPYQSGLLLAILGGTVAGLVTVRRTATVPS